MLVALALFALLGAVSAAFAVRQSASAASGAGVFNQQGVLDEVGFIAHDDSGFTSKCTESGDRGPFVNDDGTVWHFIATIGGFTSLQATFSDSSNGIQTLITNAGPNVGQHGWVLAPNGVDLTAVVATIDWGDSENRNKDKFVLSHVCPGEATEPVVTVEKTHEDLEEGPTEPYIPGDSFVWVITVSVSDGPTTEDVIVSDQLDSDLQFVSIDEDAVFEDCGESSGGITCTLPEGTANGDYEILIVVTVSETDACEIPNEVELYLVEAREPFDSDDDAVDLDCGEEPITLVLEVCKHVESDSAGGGVFTIQVEGESDFVTGSMEPGDDECTTYDVEDGAEITITETGKPAGWTDSDDFPQVSVDGASPELDTSSVTVTVGEGTCEALQAGDFAQVQEQTTEAVADCTVTFYNKSEGQTASRGLILVEKYIEIDGNLATTLPGEGLVAGWMVTVDGVSKATTLPSTVSFEAIVGENVPVSEETPAGFVVLGHTIGGGALLGGSSTNILVTEGTTLVRFYNQPLGSLTVNKVALTSHNFGPDVPSPQDRDGWLITVSSAMCGYSDTQPTGVNGTVTFNNLPMCTDYVVSEDTVNAPSPNFVPVGPASVSNVTPNNQITFTNRRSTVDILIITPTPVPPTATPTSTPVPPTATPTDTPVPPTATPTPIDEALGERTPGPTPIAPSTGTGGSGGSASMNILLLVAGLAVLSGGLSLTVAGKRRRS
jgi:hypothetical protein